MSTHAEITAYKKKISPRPDPIEERRKKEIQEYGIKVIPHHNKKEGQEFIYVLCHYVQCSNPHATGYYPTLEAVKEKFFGTNNRSACIKELPKLS
jgi:hypothetical protein